MNIFIRLFLVSAVAFGSMSAHADCDLDDVDVEIEKSSWYNRCSKRNCAELKGTAMLTSRCEEPIAVRVRLVGLDATGATIVDLERSPYAISNVSAGKHPFSLDKWVKYDSDIKSFRIEVKQVRSLEP